jgi:hypothetical protein
MADRYGKVPAPDPAAVIETYEAAVDWPQSGRWYIVRDPDTGQQRVLYQRPDGDVVGAVLDAVTLRNSPSWCRLDAPTEPEA